MKFIHIIFALTSAAVGAFALGTCAHAQGLVGAQVNLCRLGCSLSSPDESLLTLIPLISGALAALSCWRIVVCRRHEAIAFATRLNKSGQCVKSTSNVLLARSRQTGWWILFFVICWCLLFISWRTGLDLLIYPLVLSYVSYLRAEEVRASYGKIGALKTFTAILQTIALLMAPVSFYHLGREFVLGEMFCAPCCLGAVFVDLMESI